MGRFKKAARKQARLRMGLDGPSGSGKSWTAQAFAQALARFFNPTNPRVAVIDSERDSASLYQGIRETPDSSPWEFDHTNLANFSPSEYAQVIEDAGREGYDVLIVDSLSHAWEGKDGALELVNKNGGSNWKDVTPMHRRMVDAILTSPCHVIVTMRSKTDYVYETNEKGKVVPRKVGMAPIQRPGMEYEFTLYGSMDWSHIMTITKSRCPSADGAAIVKPSGSWILPIAEWLASGVEVDVAATAKIERIAPQQLNEIVKLSTSLRKPKERFEAELSKRYGVTELGYLRPEQASDLIERLEAEADAAANQRQQKTAASVPASVPTVVNETPANPVEDNRPRPSEEQLAKLKELRDQLIELDALDVDLWKAALAKREVTTALNLSPEQADEMMNSMTEMLAKVREEAAGNAGDVGNESAPASNGNQSPGDVEVNPAAKTATSAKKKSAATK